MGWNWSLHDVTEFIFNLLEMVLWRKCCASLIWLLLLSVLWNLYIYIKCYFKVTSAPVSLTLEIKTLKTATFEGQLIWVHGKFRHTTSCSPAVCLQTWFSCCSRHAGRDLFLSIVSSHHCLFHSTTGHWGTFSLLKKNNVFPVFIFRISCNCTKCGCLHWRQQSYRPVTHFQPAEGFCDSFRVDENSFFSRGEVWTPSCRVSLITLLLLSPC